jgi:hypothetical protein
VTRHRYVETSALLRALLEGDDRLRTLVSGGRPVASALTFVEATRAIARGGREQRLDAAQVREAGRQLAAFERGCSIMAVDEDVLRRARGDFPVEPIRSLDAIHLATVVILDRELGSVEVLSCDDRVRRNAVALGFVVLPEP